MERLSVFIFRGLTSLDPTFLVAGAVPARWRPIADSRMLSSCSSLRIFFCMRDVLRRSLPGERFMMDHVYGTGGTRSDKVVEKTNRNMYSL